MPQLRSSFELIRPKSRRRYGPLSYRSTCQNASALLLILVVNMVVGMRVLMVMAAACVRVFFHVAAHSPFTTLAAAQAAP